ncbi:MAG: HAD-IB family hydrolase, partial [Rhodospirillaceae bacterium]|nr:HAD-IB family hydrolase [Rhodospirillaceae bacterium]
GPASMTAKLAIFDMDRTITVHGTFTPFLSRIVKRHPGRLVHVPAIVAAAVAYKLKQLSRKELKEVMLRRIVAGVPAADIADAVAAFVSAWIPGRCRPGALQAIAAHREAGDLVMLATASNDLYVRAIADKLGADQVVATATELAADGTVTGRIPGENCYGEAKLVMVKAAIAAAGLHDRPTVFYSDHHTDLPCLRWAGVGVAVNPNARLAKAARAEGFRIVDWGRPG